MNTVRPPSPAAIGAAPAEVIAHAVAQDCAATYGDALRALILTGSLARGEASFVPSGEGWNLLGDAEFLIILHDAQPLPAADIIQAGVVRMQQTLAERGISAKLTMSPAHANFLRHMRPHLFAYELRECGRVLCGDAAALQWIPAFSPDRIPREDAWRMLSNRMIEQLEVTLAGTPQAATHGEACYRSVKLHLDMATSLLVFAGHYRPSYAGRAAALNRLADGLPPFLAPPALADWLERVARCTAWKLQPGDCPCQGAPAGFAARALADAQLLWQWQLHRLTGSREENAAALMTRWMRMQPLSERLRGWLYVARTCGWLSSARHWPRWISLATHASPRYLIYGAAGELCRAEAVTPKHWQRRLPLTPASAATPAEIAAAICRNYHQFLEGTRA